MKIEIQNLGPIHHFEFDLEKDLHLLYGENNVGKSFAVNVVYCLLKNIHELDFNSVVERKLKRDVEFIDSDKAIIDEIFKNESYGEIDVKTLTTNQCLSILNESLLPPLRYSLQNTFQSMANIPSNKSKGLCKIKLRFENLTLELSIEGDKINISKCHFKRDIKIKYSGHRVLPSIIKANFRLFVHIMPYVDIKMFYGDNEEIKPSFFDTSPGILATKVLEREFKTITQSVHDVHFLPASRSGLYYSLNSIGPIMISLSKHRYQTNKKIELPSLSEPIADYFRKLTEITHFANEANPWRNIAKSVEKIIGGEIMIDTENSQIYYLPFDSSSKLELPIAASMVGELAPIILFLKDVISLSMSKKMSEEEIQDYLDNVGYENFMDEEKEYKRTRINILIIEEPEAHLHPKVQVQLMKIFAELTEHNVKVILTSHSNYMFNQLSNMLLKKEIAPEKVGVYHMVMTDKGSIVKPDMQATEEGIEDHNFAGVAQKLYQERLETYEALNEDTDAAE